MSTIRRDPSASGERGQVLVLFAGGVLTLLVVAALAFDVGMMLLERRDEQNAADAAALAAARYVFDPDCLAATGWACVRARAAAIDVALANGYDDADPNEAVAVHIPPVQGRYINAPNFVEVDIDSDRPSIFGGAIGQGSWLVSAFGVATNDQNVPVPFSMLALNYTACKAIKVAGQGVVEANGNVHSNSNGSDCADGDGPIGLSRTGGGELIISADDATCRAAGEIQDQGSGTMTCNKSPNSFAVPDPLLGLDPPDPPKPDLAAAMQPVGHAFPVSDFCPGSIAEPPTETATQGTCNPGRKVNARDDYTGTAWILSPGLYPNGINATNDVILYLLPGVYWIQGGGFQVSGGAAVISIKDVADANVDADLATWSGNDCEMDPDTDATEACGVLIFNSESTSVPFASGPISLGGNGGRLRLSWLDVPPSDPYYEYYTLVLYQDRDVEETVTLNGSGATASDVRGIVYVPSGHLQVNGSDSDFTMDQIIADTFTVNGNEGTIRVLKDVGVDALLAAAGLVD